MPTQDRTAVIRPYRPADRDAVADVCVRTAHNGATPGAIYPDRRLMPSLFAEPYCHFEPELAFVLDDGTGRAVGYIVGTRRHRGASSRTSGGPGSPDWPAATRSRPYRPARPPRR